jgi:pyridoxal 5'-phosphate synthase pdxS subunit
MAFNVGVLALQGGFKEHLAALARQHGINGFPVRTVEQLAKCDALILPGGESTTIGFGLQSCGLLEPLRKFAKSKPVFGTCAGLILLANKLNGPSNEMALVGGLDITVARNYFGRQVDSRFRNMQLSAAAERASVCSKSYFIRAPAITSVGKNAQVLASLPQANGVAVAVRQDNLLATCFHPEISNDDSWLQYFLHDVAGAPRVGSVNVPEPTTVAPWSIVPSNKEDVLTMGVKKAFMVYQQGGVIMDVVNAWQARVAEAAGAVSVMALERIPADIKRDGGVARSSDPLLIKEIMDTTTIPVMAKARIGHFAEAQMLEALNVDCIDESEVLTAADETHHIDKRQFAVPFVCGAKNLGEALRRIAEGATMIRLKGNAGTGNVVQAVRHARSVFSEIRQLKSLADDEVFVFAKEHQVPFQLVEQVRAAGRLPVVTFAAGGLATPADVSLLMQLGCDGVFVGSGIFKGENPAERARAMVETCSHYLNARLMATKSEGLGKGMVGLLDDGETYALGGGNLDSKL